ncbi:MAG: hypothetical protein Q7S96_00370 [bacterium]|nr:hypothetical protein [bacterium]
MRIGRFVLTAAFLLIALPASAHLPRTATGSEVVVTDPEHSQVFYGELAGDAVTYRIVAEKGFNLFVNILTPLRSNPDGRFSVQVVQRIGERRAPIADLDGTEGEWPLFHEPFADDDYRKGPELGKRVTPGTYEIVVWNDAMQGKYALALGEIERFNALDVVRLLVVLPLLKVQFFGWSILEVMGSRIGVAWAIILLIVLGGGGAIVRRARRIARQEHAAHQSESSPLDPPIIL